MDLSTILVDVQPNAGGDLRLRLAIDLAKRFEAMLVGVSAGAPSPPFSSDYAGIAANELIAAQDREIRKTLAEAERRFRLHAGLARIPFDWVSRLDLPIEVLARQSGFADLVVVAQSAPSMPMHAYRAPDTGDVLMRIARPCLIVPPRVDHVDAANILIAWQTTREAQRAVRDSLPFLRRASTVAITSICETAADEESCGASLAALAAYLQRHGIHATRNAHMRRAASIADDLEDAADRHQADLVVAGAYGHGRLCEWILGGVTQAFVHRFSRCCLLSH